MLYEKFLISLTDSRHVKQNMFMGVMRSIWRSMKYQEFQGNVQQQGGALVVGPGKITFVCSRGSNLESYRSVSHGIKNLKCALF